MTINEILGQSLQSKKQSYSSTEVLKFIKKPAYKTVTNMFEELKDSRKSFLNVSN